MPTKSSATSESAMLTEKILNGGEALLSNLDLLSVLVGDDAPELVRAYPTLSRLDDATGQELAEVVGRDSTSVVRLLADRELSRRRSLTSALKGTPVASPQSAIDVLEPLVRGEARETVLALAVDTKRRLVCPPLVIGIGTNDSALCHPREVFRPLIKVAANAAIIAHSHPSSGEPAPSPEDVMLTTRLRDAGEILGIPLLDHLVIGRGYFLSMAERGLL